MGTLKSQEQFIEELKEKNPRAKLVGEYKGINVKTQFMCELGHIWEAKPSKLLRGHYCVYCTNRKVLPEYNSVYVTRPDLIKYFKNPEDAKKYTKGSDVYYDFICPDCGAIKRMRIWHLAKGFKCHECSSLGVSMPNKIIREVIKQIPNKEEYEIEYRIPEEFNKFFYDAYVKINGVKILIEMDGAQHFREISAFSRNNLEDNQNRDRLKNELAQRCHYKLIRIKTVYNNNSTTSFPMEKVIESIKNSELFNYCDINSIDWKACMEKSSENLVKEVCNYFKKNPNISFKDLGKIFGISDVCVRKYLDIGYELEWCPLREKRPSRDKRPIILYDMQGNKIKEFPTQIAVTSFLQQIGGPDKITRNIVRIRLKTTSETYGKPLNGYIIKRKEETNNGLDNVG